MRLKIATSITFIALVSVVDITTPLEAQFVDKLKDAAKRAAEDEATYQVEELSRKTVKCVFNDEECIKRAEESDSDIIYTDNDGNLLSNEYQQSMSKPNYESSSYNYADAPPPNLPAGTPSSNYDFEPGSRVLFAEDFADDNSGDFARRLEFIQGNMQVVEWAGQRFLRAESKESRFSVPLTGPLPEQFTLEFDAYDPAGSSGISVALTEPKNFGWAWAHDYPGHYFRAGSRYGSGIFASQGKKIATSDISSASEGFVPVRIMVDGAHAKMFIGETRVANVPTAQLGRSDRIYFFLEPQPPDNLTYIGNIRIAAGGKDLYQALTSEGRVSVNEILFETGLATIRPESAQILTQIGNMMQQHPNLNLLIEGHTDNEGGFDMNMQLSSNRAAAVKSYLTAEFGIDAERLRTMGLGQTRPVGSNDTPEGRQRNRRVELVRL